jgi:hypothetical protein
LNKTDWSAVSVIAMTRPENPWAENHRPDEQAGPLELHITT